MPKNRYRMIYNCDSGELFRRFPAPSSEDQICMVLDELAGRLDTAAAAGIDRDRLLIDPGFGFAKTPRHNMEVTAWLAMLHGLGCPILFGASRKSSIARLSRGEDADHRLPGSLALALAAAGQGAQVLRVHDVAETVQALALQSAVFEAF